MQSPPAWDTFRSGGTGIRLPSTEANERSMKGKILVVDDNEMNRLVVTGALKSDGYEVVTAESGEEGVSAFQRERPDCVVMDVRMPGVDGFDACDRIRATAQGKGVPILFLTGLRNVDTFDRAQAAGGDDFLTKPVRPRELLTRVQAAIELAQLGTERPDLAAFVRRQRDELLRAELQKELLMAFVVHDLKNPVNTIELLLQLLARDKSLSSDARDSIGRIRVETRHLMRLIQNLLDVAKAEEGKLAPNRTPTDLFTLAQEVTSDMQTAAADRGAAIELSGESVIVHWDADLIRRTLLNLIENAVRHTRRDTNVRVSVSPQGDHVDVRVADAGAGIEPELREKVFERFFQAELRSPAASRAGRGLGLTFCKLAVEAHGGRIWVEDAAPGAAFCFRIPKGQ